MLDADRAAHLRRVVARKEARAHDGLATARLSAKARPADTIVSPGPPEPLARRIGYIQGVRVASLGALALQTRPCTHHIVDSSWHGAP